jgi:dTDP-4-dehydrorhamnose reductase
MPINSVLSADKFTRHTGIAPRSWQEAMRGHF